MAKVKSGLPVGFNLSVSSDDLIGKPVQVGSYLDEDPVLDLIKAQRQAKMSAPVSESFEASAPAPAAPPTPQVQPVIEVAQASVELPVTPELQPSVPSIPAPEVVNEDELRIAKKPREKIQVRRLQINLTPDSERQVNELLEMISAQCAEKNVMFSEVLNALILNLYEARSELNVSRVPLRGKWGAPTARSFPIALAQAFREAITSYGMKNGANQFKKVVGG